MRKYRRFVENLKGRAIAAAFWVCATRSRRQFFLSFLSPPDASIGRFARHGWRPENGTVTVLSRNDGGFSLILSERA
jgi:hypothetical protein